MKVGTKSLLFGVHQVVLHPIIVGLSWWKLYGFPWDPRLWVAFVVHDWGYWGKPNMDGPEGEQHPYIGAIIMSIFGTDWFWFSMLHSRFLCRSLNKQPSRLCWADKLAIYYTPNWLWCVCAKLSGEFEEYRQLTNREFKGYGMSVWEFKKAANQYILDVLKKEKVL